jgi:hypothetical protein
MEEELPMVKQLFNLCLWLQLNTKLVTSVILNGELDSIKVSILAGDKNIIDFTLESFSKKSEERINIELKLIISQLIELKKDEHFK